MSIVVSIIKLVGAIFLVLQLELLLSNYCEVVAPKHDAFVIIIINLELRWRIVVYLFKIYDRKFGKNRVSIWLRFWRF